MNIFFLGLIVVVLLIIVLIFVLSKNENPKIVIHDHKIIFDEMQLPKKIENLDYSSLLQASKVIFDSFKALNYVNKEAGDLDRLEWHTWQVSLLLAFMKVYSKFFVAYDKSLFHNVILDLSEKDMDFEMQKIFKKYTNHVNIDRTRDDLSRDIIWSARDVSIIFYSMMCNKKY